MEKKNESVSSKISNVYTLTTPIQYITGNLSIVIRKTKNKRPSNEGSEILAICWWYDLIYRKSQRINEKILELFNNFSKVAVYKIGIWKSITFLYTNNEAFEKEKKTENHFIHNINNEIISNKFNQGNERSEQLKLPDLLKKKWRKHKEIERYSMLMYRKNK